MSKDTISSDDVKGLITAWLNASKTEQDEYLTLSGKAYLNGYLQANNTMELIKLEKYNTLLEQYEDLINRYEEVKQKRDKAIEKIKQLENKKWFK